MTENPDQKRTWARIAEELKAFRSNEQQLWGDLDDMAVAKFIAGTCDQTERAAVVAAMEKYPAVRELMDDLTAVLGQPQEVSPGQTDPVWQLSGRIRRLIEPLAAWLSGEGELVAEGLKQYLGRPTFGHLSPESASATDKLFWSQIPLDELELMLSISIDPPGADEQWSLRLDVNRDHKQLPQPATLQILDGERVEFAMPLSDCLNAPIYVNSGQWRISIKIADATFEMPLSVGGGPT